MDLISKEDAVALITAEMDKIRTHSLVDGTARINLRLAKNIIEDMPSIDIVRCRECKFREANKSIYRGTWYCSNHGDTVDLDDYCSLGERSKR